VRAALALVAVALVASPAFAQQPDLAGEPPPRPPSDDYDIDNNKWNGLTTFAALARGMNLSVEMRRELEWRQLEPNDLLVILYPDAKIVPRHVGAFINGGGRVVIGDDFGTADRIFAELGLLRGRAVGVGASRFYDNLPFAPFARAAGEHPLSQGAPTIATNHPAILTSLGFTDPVYRFGGSETVVAAGEQGSGRLVAIADPSVLINRMLQFENNFQFAVNLVRYLMMDGGSRRMIIVTGTFALSGEPPPNSAADDGTALGLVNAANELLRELNQYVATSATGRGLSVLIAGALSLLLLLVLPLRPRGDLDGRWIRARPDAAPPLGLDGIAALYDRRTTARTSFALAAGAVRDAVSRRLGDELGVDDPLYNLSEPQLFDALNRAGHAEAAAQLRPVYRKLRDLPSRAHASQWERWFVSQRDFERLHAAVGQVYRSLGE
jgi:hypothetical protein